MCAVGMLQARSEMDIGRSNCSTGHGRSNLLSEWSVADQWSAGQFCGPLSERPKAAHLADPSLYVQRAGVTECV